MHPSIQNLANRFGILLVDRNASETWIFDGTSIATYYNWRGDDELVHFSDHDLLHEIAHWIAAKPEQRDLPEYGLALGIASEVRAMGPKGLLWDDEGCKRIMWTLNLMDGLVDREEQDIQEFLAQLICIKLGPLLGISPAMSEEKYIDSGFTQNWDVYKAAKFLHAKKAGLEFLWRIAETRLFDLAL